MNTQITITNITFGKKIAVNVFVYSMLLLCAYVSQDSAWWTFVTGFFFILCLVGQAKALAKETTTVLKSKAEAIAWANSLPDDEKS